MARAGLKKVVKTVKGKKKSVRRTYWVKSAASKKTSGFMAKARNLAGNHYLQSALIGAATGAAARVNRHNAQKKDYAANVSDRRRIGPQFGQNNVRAIGNGIAGTAATHAVTQILAGRRRADRHGTMLATVGGQVLGGWAAGKLVRPPANAHRWHQW